MVLYSAFLHFEVYSKCFNNISHLPIHSNRCSLTHIVVLSLRATWGSVPKDTSTCGLEKPGTAPHQLLYKGNFTYSVFLIAVIVHAEVSILLYLFLLSLILNPALSFPQRKSPDSHWSIHLSSVCVLHTCISSLLITHLDICPLVSLPDCLSCVFSHSLWVFPYVIFLVYLT